MCETEFTDLIMRETESTHSMMHRATHTYTHTHTHTHTHAHGHTHTHTHVIMRETESTHSMMREIEFASRNEAAYENYSLYSMLLLDYYTLNGS